ncbi:MAG: hypothetical protein RLZZ200_1605 [Pseudomonadota bacterium]|jgi:iron complex outermembrane receptor protein
MASRGAASVLAASAVFVAQDVRADSSGTLDEIVVTSEKRATNIQTASLAVSVLTADDLQKKDVKDLRDLQNATPSLSVTEAGILTFMNIRGVGLLIQTPTVVSGVATYRDGLFSPSPIFLTEPLYDMASVEVLRGPQGTFVGQNSTGGAVYQVSRSPVIGSDRVEGNVGVKVGSFSELGTEGAANLPISSTLAARVAWSTTSRDSYFDNIVNTSAHPGSLDHKNLRVGLLWEPSDAFSLLVKSEVNIARDGGYTSQPQPGSPLAAFASPDPWKLKFDRGDIHDDEASLRNSVEAKWTLPSGITVRSISGFQLGTQNFLTDTDGGYEDGSYNHQRILDRVYSQEIDVISPDTGRFRWTVGGSYVKQTAHLDLHILNDRFPFGPTGAPAGVAPIFPQMDIWIFTTNPKVAEGVFAQGTYELTKGLELQVGGRYSHDEQTQSGALTLLPNPPLPGVIPASSPRYSDNHATGKVALNWTVSDEHFLYAFVANGYKPGGVNLPAGDFKAETVVDYELGWKATLAGGHVRTQLGLFNMNYHGMQMNIVDTNSGTNSVGNAERSTIRGAEFQLQAKSGRFSTDLNVSYVDSSTGGISLVDVRALPGGSTNGLGPQCAVGQAPPACFNYDPYRVSLDGRPTPYAPKLTANAGVEYSFASENGVWTPRFDVTHLSDQYSSLFAGRFDRIPTRTLANASLSYRSGDWRTTLAVTNITDKTYVSGIDDGSGFMWLGAPRVFRLSVNRAF